MEIYSKVFVCFILILVRAFFFFECIKIKKYFTNNFIKPLKKQNHGGLSEAAGNESDTHPPLTPRERKKSFTK